MNTPKGYIIFVDDRKDEHEIFELALREICSCKVVFAFNGLEALELMRKHKSEIFAVVSDINMPKMNGLELKRVIEGTPELKLMAIPFIYYSSSVEPIIVKEAYSLGIQGFIEKRGDFRQSVKNLEHFIKFWATTVHPRIFSQS